MTSLPEIYCSPSHCVSWSRSNGQAMMADDEVHVWKAALPDHSAGLEYFSGLLNENEMERSNRYHHTKDRDRFILRRGILKWLLAGYLSIHPTAVRFRAGLNKKPELDDDRYGFRFNLAHSGDMVLMAFANSDIGVDLERVDQSFEWSEIVSSSFTEMEQDLICKSETPAISFFEIWTRKEALVKATGKGISDDLSATSCLPGVNRIGAQIIGSARNWTTMTIDAGSSYTGSVCHVTQAIPEFFLFDRF